jgi:Na+-transporting NADH:ubiquinone oxidoreductase subunit E
MENLINIFIKSIFIDNMVFAFFFGMCSYLAVSKTVKTSMGLGLAVIFVLGITVPANYMLNKYILAEGALTSMVQLVEMIVEKFAPTLYSSLGIFLPLIAVNCAILGGSLFMQERDYSTLAEATSFGLGSGIGWLLAIVGIAAIREKIRYSNIPAPLRGLGITFIVTGLMGIAFMSFMGIKL